MKIKDKNQSYSVEIKKLPNQYFLEHFILDYSESYFDLFSK